MKSEIVKAYSGVYERSGSNKGGKSGHATSRKTPMFDTSKMDSVRPFSSCLLDHSGRHFVCSAGEECRHCFDCLEHEPAHANYDFEALNFHPDDKALLQKYIFPDILMFMEKVPVEEFSNYRFSFNHRFIRKDGSVSQFLQDGVLDIKDDQSQPVLKLKVFTEIGDIKTDETMILTLFRYYADQGFQKVFTKVYGENCNSCLSGRELSIIKLCLEGLSSKMIADRLKLSIHTVKNHKRNCMEKTLTHNITELIHLCILNHWL